nr:hypothetical protein [Luteimonas sp. XNQY3]
MRDTIAGARFGSEVVVDGQPDGYASAGPDEHLTGEALSAGFGTG